jgi:putative salt-induced outer membrane protein YdiY
MKRSNRTHSRLAPCVGVILAILNSGGASAQTTAATNAPPKKSPWEGNAALGLTVTRGNSDTLLFNLNVQGTRKWDKNELRLKADGTYGENNGTRNNEQARGIAQYNRIFGHEDRWFVYGRLEALHDGIASVKGRISISPGVGYYFVKNARTSLSGEVGPGFVEEKLGDAPWHDYLTLRAAERFEFKINERSRLWQSVEWLPQVDDLSNYIINAEIGVSTTITPKWDLRVVLQDSYDNQPAPGRKQNDLKLIAGVGFKFL